MIYLLLSIFWQKVLPPLEFIHQSMVYSQTRFFCKGVLSDRHFTFMALVSWCFLSKVQPYFKAHVYHFSSHLPQIFMVVIKNFKPGYIFIKTAWCPKCVLAFVMFASILEVVCHCSKKTIF